MANLSQKAQDLFTFMQKDYVEQGYMYSGSWPYMSLIERGFDKETIHELQESGKIQKRNCDDYAFELSAAERGELISRHDLCSVWYEKAGNALLESIQAEIQDAAEIPYNKDTGLFTVRTMKVQGDTDKPERMEVTCPFSIGQVIDLEYDLPRKRAYSGYSSASFSSRGKAVGQFMVTDVIHNLMVSPRMNLLEVQSLCEEFNKLYPRERTMMVFEDVVLKRLKNNTKSLSDQIKSATIRASESHSPVTPPAKESAPERSFIYEP